MDYFPAFLRLQGKHCLLVGGGEVATRKARLLMNAGARLTVVAPDICGALIAVCGNGDVSYHRRKFRDDDVRDHWLIVAATDDEDLQIAIAKAAERAGIFCNCVDNLESGSYITPAIVDRGALVVAVTSSGNAPVLARSIRQRIEAMLPAATGELARIAGRWRARVDTQVKDALSRRRFWEAFFAGPVASAVYGGDFDAANRESTDLLERIRGSQSARGEVWLVGAGPGDPDLLTLRALQVLQTADIIVHDRLVSDEILALARRDAGRIAVGKIPGRKQNSQESINALLSKLAASGKRVCRLKGGDPFIFGRGGEELEAVTAAGFACHVVPGITAAAGCAAYAAIPLTHRDAAQSVVFVTAHGKDSIDRLDWKSLARDRQTIAIYMGVGRFSAISKQLIAHGRAAATPIAIIENGTTPQQRVVRGRLGHLALLASTHRIQAPSMLVIGEVAKLHNESVQRRSSTSVEHGYAERLARIHVLPKGLAGQGDHLDFPAT
jgi:uroporphyrin-III C-methyltransferase/precorrin-2 dehydrogenase/sirohydrochlorin ferrochelatase